MKQKFSQFSVGELEAGARKRQGLAEARRHAQVRRAKGKDVHCLPVRFVLVQQLLLLILC